MIYHKKKNCSIYMTNMSQSIATYYIKRSPLICSLNMSSYLQLKHRVETVACNLI